MARLKDTTIFGDLTLEAGKNLIINSTYEYNKEYSQTVGTTTESIGQAKFNYLATSKSSNRSSTSDKIYTDIDSYNDSININLEKTATLNFSITDEYKHRQDIVNLGDGSTKKGEETASNKSCLAKIKFPFSDDDENPDITVEYELPEEGGVILTNKTFDVNSLKINNDNFDAFSAKLASFYVTYNNFIFRIEYTNGSGASAARYPVFWIKSSGSGENIKFYYMSPNTTVINKADLTGTKYLTVYSKKKIVL